MLLRARGVDINAYDKVAGAPDCASFKSTNNMSTSKKKDKEVEGAASPGNGSGDKEEMLVAEDVEEDETPSFWIMVRGALGCCCGKGTTLGERALANEKYRFCPREGGGKAVRQEMNTNQISATFSREATRASSYVKVFSVLRKCSRCSRLERSSMYLGGWFYLSRVSPLTLCAVGINVEWTLERFRVPLKKTCSPCSHDEPFSHARPNPIGCKCL